MAKAYSKALDKHIEIERVLGKINGGDSGPTIIFIGGMHGNEPSGVFALDHVFKNIKEKNLNVIGTVYGVVGNIKALEKGIRYLDEDLNRLWTSAHMKELLSKLQQNPSQETDEQVEIYELLLEILNNASNVKSS